MCDSTNINKGKVNGVIRRLELSLQRPLQWFICLLHTNELPLREYFEVLDGETTGPRTSMGMIGTDQKYLYKAYIGIQNGIDSHKLFLESSQPGCLNNARWLTKANRILCYYMSEENPSLTLKHLVSFILNFYAPSWFHIKANGSGQHGAKNFYFMIQLFQGLEERDQDIIRLVLEHNYHFAHPENIFFIRCCRRKRRDTESGN